MDPEQISLPGGDMIPLNESLPVPATEGPKYYGSDKYFLKTKGEIMRILNELSIFRECALPQHTHAHTRAHRDTHTHKVYYLSANERWNNTAVYVHFINNIILKASDADVRPTGRCGRSPV